MNKIIHYTYFIILIPYLLFSEPIIDSLLNFKTLVVNNKIPTFEDLIDTTVPPYSLFRKVIKADLFLAKSSDNFYNPYCMRINDENLVLLHSNIKKDIVDSIIAIFLNEDYYGCRYKEFPPASSYVKGLKFGRQELYRMYTDDGDTLDIRCSTRNNELFFIYKEGNEISCEKDEFNPYSVGSRKIAFISNLLSSLFSDTLSEDDLEKQKILFNSYLYDERYLRMDLTTYKRGCVKIIGGEKGIKISKSDSQNINIDIEPIIKTKLPIMKSYNKYLRLENRFRGELHLNLTIDKSGTVIDCKKTSEDNLNKSFEYEVMEIMKELKFNVNSESDIIFEIDVPLSFKCK